MVIQLSSHGLQRHGPGGRGRFGSGMLDDLTSYAKNTFATVSADSGVKARGVAGAIQSVTGIAPQVDTSDPKVTWVRTVPAHAAWMEAVFLKSVASGPDDKPANMKIDMMPALTPILLKRILPVLLLVGAGLVAVGYFIGKD